MDYESILYFRSTKKETWESVYIYEDPNHIFNPFLRTFLNIF